MNIKVNVNAKKSWLNKTAGVELLTRVCDLCLCQLAQYNRRLDIL